VEVIPIPIVVSPHALARARMRFRAPAFTDANVRDDVKAALAAGRKAKHARGVHWKPGGSGRLVWSKCGRRVYLITRHRTSNPACRHVWMVVTALVPDHVTKAA
jgi:hypothetical protein